MKSFIDRMQDAGNINSIEAKLERKRQFKRELIMVLITIATTLIVIQIL